MRASSPVTYELCSPCWELLCVSVSVEFAETEEPLEPACVLKIISPLGSLKSANICMEEIFLDQLNYIVIPLPLPLPLPPPLPNTNKTYAIN